MKKIIILIPVFNDWESLKKLLNGRSSTGRFAGMEEEDQLDGYIGNRRFVYP